MSPSQDMVMGCYYITVACPIARAKAWSFASLDEADWPTRWA
jgi:hypothetical protein